MARRTMFTKLGQGEPAARTHAPLAARRLEMELREQAGDNAQAARGPAPADVPAPEPERMSPLPQADKALVDPLDVPRPFTVSNDVASATEDGAPVIISVLGNDVGAAAVARINGVAVTPGNIITLQSGARVIVNANGTLSYEVGTAFQSLAAGQTAQDVFTYAASDGGGSPLAPEGVFNAAAINGTNGFVIHGAAAGDRSGYSVAGIGDVNGDGRDDLLISALSADLPGRIDAGVSYVVYGRQGGFGASLDLGGLTAATGFAITGVNAFDFSGASARAAGDVNGDGLADFIIGAPWGEASQGTNAGESYLVFGRQGGFGTGLDLATLNGTNGVTFRGVAAGDGLGFAVSAAGDINGDGFDDLILGAREANGTGETDSGASYVVFGRAGGFTSTIDVAGLTGANGFAIIGADATDRSGYSVAAAGDVNGDGIDDLIIGAPQGDPGGRANAGEAYVVFGRQGGFGATLDLGTLSGTTGFTISGVDAGDHAGWSVASAGDLNGDGRADMVIGALYADPAGRESAGETYVVFGRSGGFGANLDLSSMTASMGFTITGTAAANLTGHSVASAGDVNGDGIDDLLIGAIYADGTGGVDAGETYVVFGRATGFSGTLDLATLNGQNGFAIGGIAAGDFSGQSVSAAGDVNGDGFDDLIIGAPMADPSGRADAGSSYVVFGAADFTRISTDATVTVTVTGVNDAPVITSNGGGATGAYTIVENTTGPNTVTAFDPDTGSNLTFSIIGGADSARFTINSSGVISLISAPDFEAPTDQNGDNVYEVIVQVSDGQLTDTQTINLTVTNANEAPVITSGGGGPSASVPGFENSTTATTVVAVDPDAGANLAYSILSGRDGARFAIDSATGVLTFVTAPDFEAPTDQNGDNVYEVDVQVSDGLGGTDVQTLFINVGDAPETPVITSNGGGATAGYTIAEGTLGPNPVTAIDPDTSSVLTYSIIGGADAALFTINASGVLSLISPPDFEAPADQNGDNVYEVIVQVSDGQLTDTQTINLTVTNANEAPVITSNGGGAVGGYTISENTNGPNPITAADPDAGTNLTYSIIGGPDAALFTINAGVISFINPPDFEAPADQGGDNVYQVIVQTSDGQLTDTQTINITVTNANEAPAITSGGGGTGVSFGVSENTTAVITMTASDPDAGAVLTWSIVASSADAALFAIDPATGVLTFVGPPSFEAPADQNGDNTYVVDVQVSDGQGGVDVQTLNVQIGDVPEAPVITSLGGGATGGYTISENTTGPSQVTAFDQDAGSNLSYFILTGGDSALFTMSPTGVLSFINAPDFETPADQNGDNVYEVTVQVSDGTRTDSQTISVTVTNTNEAPVITSAGGGPNGTISVNENTTAATTLTAADPDAGAQITWSITGGADAALFSIDAATGAVSFLAPADFETPLDAGADNNYDIVVRASDGVNSDSQNLRITVTDVVEPGRPVLTGLSPSVTFSENVVNTSPQLIDFAVTFTDSDGDFAGGTLSLSGVLDEDRIAVRNEGSGAGQIGLSASSSVTYGGVVIGLLTGGVGTDLTITFNAAATSAAIDALIQNLTYANVSDAPTATRNLVLNVTDAAGNGLGSGPRFTQQTGANNPFDGLSVGGNTVPRPALADLDGDGDLDAVVGQFYGTLSYFENTGTVATPTFVQRVGTANPFDGVDTGFFSAPVMADMDRDGDLDAVLGTGSGTVNYLENTGTEQAPTFISRTGSANPFNGISLGTDTLPAPVDLDGDGDLDLVVGRRDGLLNYFENTGSASTAVFTARTGSANPFNGVDVGTFSHPRFADIDGDGDLDAVVGEYQGTLLYFENTGSVTAPVFVQRTGQANPFDGFNVAFASSPTLGDLDGDGDLDVLVGEDVGTLNYLRNTTFPAPSITVTVTDSNDAPVITSAGGGPNGTVTVAENSQTVATVTAADPDAGAQITWSITGGADAALFSIDADTGEVSFLAPPDFETPLDAGADNNYDIVVQASDGVSTDTQNLRVTVTDVAESTLSLTDVVGLLAVKEGDPFVLIDSDVTFTDAGDSYDGGLLAVTGLFSTDLITVRNVGTGSGQISIETGTVFFEGVDIGTIAPTQNVFSVLLNANANRAAIEALVEALEYRSTSDVAVPPHNIAIGIFNSLSQSSGPVFVPIQFTADILNGTAGDDILDGLGGNDVINGFDGLDTLSGGDGNDTLFGGNGNDTLDGGVADDILIGDDGDDTLTGGDGRDVLVGNALNDIMNGGASDDFLDGGSGDDTMNGGGEDDRLLGGAGVDTLNGGDGHDRIDGGDGDDTINGAAGHDLITGGAGVDTMRGGDGDDQLEGGIGNDEVRGEAGIDTAIFKGLSSAYTIQFITAGVVQVTGADGTDLVYDCEFLQFDDQLVSVTPAANNEPPRITSNGGGLEAAIDINEGQTAVTTVVATDLFPGAVTYSIFGGADAARFTIDAATGALSFITPPDFEAPTDAGRDNTYDVIVSASDGQFSDLQGITVTVLDVAGSPIPSTKGGGPEICYGPDDDGGDTGAPQVLPGMSDKIALPPLADDWGDLREARDFFPQDSAYERTLPSADPLQQPPITPWDDGFA
jgi:Ca2+-binding RTX toxin-like protein